MLPEIPKAKPSAKAQSDGGKHFVYIDNGEISTKWGPFGTWEMAQKRADDLNEEFRRKSAERSGS
jgi:hypothetical protein